MYLAFFTAIPLLISACGGTSEKDPSSQLQPDSLVTSNVEASRNSTSTATSSPEPISSSSQSSVGLAVLSLTQIQLQLYKLNENSITLVWDDAAGTSHYDIARNGEFIAKVNSPSHTLVDQGLTPYTNYSYTITSFDSAGNESAAPKTLTLRTLAASKNIISTSSPGIPSEQVIFSSSSKSGNGDQSSSGVKSSNFHSSSSVKFSNSSRSNSSFKTSNSSRSSSSVKSSNSSRSSSSVKSSNSSRSSSSAKSSNSSQSSSSSNGPQAVIISWSHPSHRENGLFLALDEIGGYEIRYRKPAATSYKYITLKGNSATEYTFTDEEDGQDLEFEIAVFDTDGLYSQFVKVTQ
jgi:hypothetical protein